MGVIKQKQQTNMVETDRVFQTGGILKEDFDSSEGAQIFQEEKIDPAELNFGLIMDMKQRVNDGSVRSFKPNIGKTNLSDFAQPKPLPNEQRFHVKGNSSDQVYPVDSVVFGSGRELTNDDILKEDPFEDPDIARWDNNNK